MDWYSSYSRRFRVYGVSDTNWDDLAEIGRVESLDIAWDADSDTIQDGSLQVIGEQPEGWVRIYLEADGEGEQARVPVATMRSSCVERAIIGDTFSSKADLDSVLFEASETELPDGYFAPRGADPVRFALTLIRKHTAAPVEIERSDTSLPHTVVAEHGDTVVTFSKTLLEGTGSRLTVDGRGVVRVAHDDEPSSLGSFQVYADGVTDKTDKGVRTVSYSRPYDPSITEGSDVTLSMPAQGISGRFTVKTQRLSDDCTVQEVVSHGVA